MVHYSALALGKKAMSIPLSVGRGVVYSLFPQDATVM